MNVKSKSYITPFLILYALIICIYGFISFIYAKQLDKLFNSDQLKLFYLYQDLMIDHHSIQHWIFVPVLYFFPDGLLLFVIKPWVNSIGLTYIILYVIYLLLFCYLIVAVGTLISGKNSKNIFYLSVIFSLILAMTGGLGRELFLPLFNSHFGATILVYLLALYWVIQLSSRQTFGKGLLLSVICMITSFSDPLFAVIFVGSTLSGLILIILIEKKKSLRFAKAVLLSIGSCLIGFACNHYNLIPSINIDNYLVGTAHFNWVTFYTVFKALSLYFNEEPIILILCFVYLIAVGIICVKGIFLKNKSYDKNLLFLLATIAAGFPLITICSIILDPDYLYPTFSMLRHFQSAILLPVFLGIPILLVKYTDINLLINRYINSTLVIIIGSVLLFGSFLMPNQFKKIYPVLTKCLDEFREQGELPSANGIANYWDGHVTNIFSKRELNVVAVRKLKSYNWASTKADYKNKFFHFAVVRGNTEADLDNNINADYLIKYWGIPDKKLVCSENGNYQIYIYNKGRMIE